MHLTCECDYSGDSDWYFEVPNDYSTLVTSRRKRCCSCNALIDIGATVLQFSRYRDPNNDIEWEIHCEHVPLATWHMCEECSDIFYSLDALGFCSDLNESQHDRLKEYIDVYGPENKAA